MQDVIIGENSIKKIFKIIVAHQFKRVLAVTGHHADSYIDETISLWEGFEVFRISIPSGLPIIESIDSIFRQLPWVPDAVAAIGGGRIIDSAKYFISKKSEKPFFIAAPSTAGSGSEATPFAVVYSGYEKQSITDPRLIPDLAILDPLLLKSLPSHQRAVSGLDALVQSIESIWNIHSTEYSKIFARQAYIELERELLPFVHKKGFNNLKQVQWAAYLSGKAIAYTKTTACHALSYYLTSHHNISHGHAVALFMPPMFIYNAPAEDDMKDIYELMGVSNAEKASERFRTLIKSCSLATTFPELGIQVDIEKLVDSVNHERFANNPVPFNRLYLQELLQQQLY